MPKPMARMRLLTLRAQETNAASVVVEIMVTGSFADCLLGVLSLVMLGSCSSSGQTTNQRAELQTPLICQEAIRSQLKAPANATFPEIAESEVRRAAEDRDIVRILTYVDIQDASGAVLRKYFQCDSELKNGRWMLRQLREIKR
jgi:hypothetical protein